MKKTLINITAVTGLIFALIVSVSGFAASVEADVKAYLEGKNPQSLSEYPPAFAGVYEKHAPLIKESTMATVLYYFDSTKANTYNDITTLSGQAVTAAIAEARKTGEDNVPGYITGAVCGSFKGGLDAAYIQVTSAKYAVRGGLTAALSAGVEPGTAATAVVRGIDACLQERLIYEVALVVGRETSSILGGQGFAYYYDVPYTAYLPIDGTRTLLEIPPDGGGGGDVCVSDCVNEPEPVPPEPPICISNCL